MIRTERIHAAEAKLRIARRLADLGTEHHRIGDGLMQAAARAADEARRIAEAGTPAKPLIPNGADLRPAVRPKLSTGH